jgi:hypothetical protein
MFRGMKGQELRELALCKASAASSFPVPLSPRISWGVLLFATRLIA